MPPVHVYRTDEADAPRVDVGVTRRDRGQLRPADRTVEGYLFAQGYAGRVGVLRYVEPDGKARREYVPRETLDDAAANATLKNRPFTLRHPQVPVNAKNVRSVISGTTSDPVIVEVDGDTLLQINCNVLDASAVRAIDAGECELSLGYTCDIEWTAGMSPAGEPYDCVQRNRRYNHTAAVERGRAGRSCAIRTDQDEIEVPMHPTLLLMIAAGLLTTPRTDSADKPIGDSDSVDKLRADREIADAVRATLGSDVKPGDVKGKLEQLRTDSAEPARRKYATERAPLITRAAALKIDHDKLDNDALTLAVARAYMPAMSADATVQYARAVVDLQPVPGSNVRSGDGGPRNDAGDRTPQRVDPDQHSYRKRPNAAA